MARSRDPARDLTGDRRKEPRALWQRSKPLPGNTAKTRHRKDRQKDRQKDKQAPMPAHPLNGRIAPPQITSRHITVLEFVQNRDKKRKLEVKKSFSRIPPPGYEFVPMGNPHMTTACKDMSREQEAMVFLVSLHDPQDDTKFAHHMNRVGHHFRQTIVEAVRERLGQSDESPVNMSVDDAIEPIPKMQAQISAQADGALRDLFPRMPHIDRENIIAHSFSKRVVKSRVGLASNIPLYRRVALGVLAHIRHNLTRYDQLLRETTWANARQAVERPCLEILAKWRGDEETGRDQLDEIIRETIVISDSEDGDDENSRETEDVESGGDDTSGDGDSENSSDGDDKNSSDDGDDDDDGSNSEEPVADPPQEDTPRQLVDGTDEMWGVYPRPCATTNDQNAPARRVERGFRRYKAVMDQSPGTAPPHNRYAQGNVQLSSPQAVGQTIAHGYGPSQRIPQEPEVATNDLGIVTLRGEPVRATHFPSDSHGDRNALASRWPATYTPVARFEPVRAGERVRTATARREDLRDYLVPSIEPASPEGAQFVPRFIRQVPPSEVASGEATSGPSRYHGGHAPAPTSFVEGESVSRCRVTDDRTKTAESSRIISIVREPLSGPPSYHHLTTQVESPPRAYNSTLNDNRHAVVETRHRHQEPSDASPRYSYGGMGTYRTANEIVDVRWPASIAHDGSAEGRVVAVERIPVQREHQRQVSDYIPSNWPVSTFRDVTSYIPQVETRTRHLQIRGGPDHRDNTGYAGANDYVELVSPGNRGGYRGVAHGPRSNNGDLPPQQSGVYYDEQTSGYRRAPGA